MTFRDRTMDQEVKTDERICHIGAKILGYINFVESENVFVFGAPDTFPQTFREGEIIKIFPSGEERMYRIDKVCLVDWDNQQICLKTTRVIYTEVQ